jgi:tetratricopeptide (TPR) repeat protein
MSRTLNLLLPGVLLLIASGAAMAQLSEEEIALQSKFIDATREKLLGENSEAIALLDGLFKENSSNAAVAFELGRLHLVSKAPLEAVRFLETARRLDPSNNWYALYLADAYQSEGRYGDAAAIYGQLAGQQPLQASYYYQWAEQLAKAQQTEQALKVYAQLESVVGFNEEIARRRHTLHAGTGNKVKAAAELERLVATFPTNRSYRYLLATYYESGKDWESARRTYQQILQQWPDDSQARLALMRQSAGNEDEIAYLNSLEAVFSKPDVSLDEKIKNLLPSIEKVAQTGQPALADAALRLTEILEKQYPGAAKPLAASADLLMYSQRKAEALVKYQAAVAADKSVFAVWENLMLLCYTSGNMVQLRKYSEMAMDYYPNKILVYYYAALAHENLHNYSQAINYLQDAMMIPLSDEQLSAELTSLQAYLFMKQGQQQQSLQAFSEALRLRPNSAEVSYRYALWLQANGQSREALRLAQQAAGSQPGNFFYLETLARVQFLQRDFLQAKATLDRALAAGADQWVAVLDLYGDVLYHLNQLDEALQYWEKARQQGADWPAVTKKIAQKKWHE